MFFIVSGCWNNTAKKLTSCALTMVAPDRTRQYMISGTARGPSLGFLTCQSILGTHQTLTHTRAAASQQVQAPPLENSCSDAGKGGMFSRMLQTCENNSATETENSLRDRYPLSGSQLTLGCYKYAVINHTKEPWYSNVTVNSGGMAFEVHQPVKEEEKWETLTCSREWRGNTFATSFPYLWTQPSCTLSVAYGALAAHSCIERLGRTHGYPYTEFFCHVCLIYLWDLIQVEQIWISHYMETNMSSYTQ